MISIGSVTVFSSVFVGASLLTVGGPVLGELVATMAPIFTRGDIDAINRHGIEFEEIEFPTTDGLMLRGWFFPAKRNESPAILYAPATAHDQRSGLSLVLPLHQAGYHVLLFSYRGHGSSDGDRFGFTYGAEESKDVDSAVSYLYDVQGIRQIGAIGHSAGASSLILSAARNPRIGALVAASPYSSVEEIWATNRPKLFPKPLFDLTMALSERRKNFSRHEVRPKDVISQISPRPLLFIHGSGDKRITLDQAQDLFDMAGEPKNLWIMEGASHSGVRSPVMDTRVDEIIDFFDDAF